MTPHDLGHAWRMIRRMPGLASVVIVSFALGATAEGVGSHIVGESLRVIGAGALAGWSVMFMIALHLLRGAIDLPAFAGVPAILLLVATLACWVPARRSTRVDPTVALRRV